MKIFFSILLLIVVSCSHIDVKDMGQFKNNDVDLLISNKTLISIKSILENETLYLDQIAETSFKEELKLLLAGIKIISYEKNACSTGQVACSDPEHPGVVFVNENFFLMIPLEQFTGLLHEAAHLQSKNFTHVQCLKKPEWGYECDETINSPYGIEYKYLLHKYMHSKDDLITQLLLKINYRINKI
ncbi:MAG: hypothetical protein H7177_03130 [Rhizobacter sp.]|nr:hypothetical protein [Bacteriovorax sp.]